MIFASNGLSGFSTPQYSYVTLLVGKPNIAELFFMIQCGCKMSLNRLPFEEAALLRYNTSDCNRTEKISTALADLRQQVTGRTNAPVLYSFNGGVIEFFCVQGFKMIGYQ
jgi:hypothetical protein